MKRENSGDQKKYVIEHLFCGKKCAMKILSDTDSEVESAGG